LCVTPTNAPASIANATAEARVALLEYGPQLRFLAADRGDRASPGREVGDLR
jgi:hypothetical protein